jgi:apolipoprotein N-acyltransferase
MKPFKLLYHIASFMWLAFSAATMGYFVGWLSFERFVLTAFLLVATLLEEIYYLIEEKVIDGK